MEVSSKNEPAAPELPGDEQLVKDLTNSHAATRYQAYDSVCKKMASPALVDFRWTLVKKSDLLALVKMILSDLETSNLGLEVCQNLISLVGHIVANFEFVNAIPLTQLQEMASLVCKVAMKENDKRVYVMCLWGFALKKYPRAIYERYSDQLVDTIIAALTSQSSSVVSFESLTVLLYLLEVVGVSVVEKSIDFYPEVFPRLFHKSIKVRGLAITCTQELLKHSDNKEVLRSIVKGFHKPLSAVYSDLLIELVAKSNYEGLEIWRLVVEMLGRNLHSGINLINKLLTVVEKGFKNPDPKMRAESFLCWKTLANNFALDRAVLTSSKRLKLMIAPFMANNAKSEQIVQAKIAAWWQLIVNLEASAQPLFDQVLVPFLQFGFVNDAKSSLVAGLTGRNLAASGANMKKDFRASSMKELIYMFHQIVSSNSDSSDESIKIDQAKLTCSILNSQIYSKHYSLLHRSFGEVVLQMCANKYELESVKTLTNEVLKLLNTHIMEKSKTAQKEAVDALKDFVKVLQKVVDSSNTNMDNASFALEIMSSLTCGPTALPKNVMTSRAFAVSTTDMLCGSPASHLLNLLVRMPIFRTVSTNRQLFTSVWRALVACPCEDGVAQLAFISSATNSLSSSLLTANSQEEWLGGSSTDTESVTSLWLVLCDELHKHVSETSIIDQGDSVEADYGAVLNLLLMPLKHSTFMLKEINSNTLTLVKSCWKKLYSQFLYHLGASSNVETTVLLRKAMSLVSSDSLKGPLDMHADAFHFLSIIMSVVTENFDYTCLSKPKPKILTPSKAALKTKKSALLELGDVASSMCQLWSKVVKLVGALRCPATICLCSSILSILQGLKVAKMIPVLLKEVSETLLTVIQVNPAARYGPDVERSVLSLWDIVCTLLEEHVTCNVVPAFAAGLIKTGLGSSNVTIMVRTRKLWLSVDIPRVTVPIELKSALQQLSLPPYAPKPDVVMAAPGSAGKQKLRTPASPARSPIGSTKKKSVKRLNCPVALEDMDDMDFVKISSPAPTKRIMTPHQKEKMREQQSHIPAMYNDLSQQCYSQSLLDSSSCDTSSRLADVKKVTSPSIIVRKGPAEVDKKFGTPSKSAKDVESKKDSTGKPKSSSAKNIFKTDSSKMNESQTIDEYECSPPSNLSFEERAKKVAATKQTPADKKTVETSVIEDSDSESEIIPDSQVGKQTPLRVNFLTKADKFSSSIEGVEPLPKTSSLDTPTKVVETPKVSQINSTLAKEPSASELLSTPKNSAKQTKAAQAKEMLISEALTVPKKLPKFTKAAQAKEVSTAEVLLTPKKLLAASVVGSSSPDKITRSGRKVKIPQKEVMDAKQLVKKCNVSETRDKDTEVTCSVKEIAQSAEATSVIEDMETDENEPLLTTGETGKKASAKSSEMVDELQTEKPKILNSKEKKTTPSKSKFSAGRKRKRESDDDDDVVTKATNVDDKTEPAVKDKQPSISKNEDRDNNATDELVLDNLQSDLNASTVDASKSVVSGEDATKQTQKSNITTKRSSEEMETPSKKAGASQSVVAEETDTPRRRTRSLISLTAETDASKARTIGKKRKLEDASTKVTRATRSNLDVTLPVNEYPLIRAKKPKRQKLDKNEGVESSETSTFASKIVSKDASVAETVVDSTSDKDETEVIVKKRGRRSSILMTKDTYTKCPDDTMEESDLENTLMDSSVCLDTTIGDVDLNLSNAGEGLSSAEESDKSGDEISIKKLSDKSIDNKEDQTTSVTDVPVAMETSESSEIVQLHEPVAEVNELIYEVVAAVPEVFEPISEVAPNTSDAEASDTLKIATPISSPTATIPKPSGVFASPTTTLASPSLLSPSTTPVSANGEKRAKAGIRPGSRAAMMVACAKRNVKNNTPPQCTPTSNPFIRKPGDRPTPARVHRTSESSLARDMLDSPTRANDSLSATPSALHKSRLLDTPSDKPWARHQPSPHLSPSVSILKCQTPGPKTTPTSSKTRRVSFADPVSASVLIPNTCGLSSPSAKAHKRLDMSKAKANAKEIIVDIEKLPQAPSKESLAQLIPVGEKSPDGDDQDLCDIPSSQSIYSSLVQCTESVQEIIPELTTPTLEPALKSVLDSLAVSTIGQLARLTESDLTQLPLRMPKLACVVRALRLYEQRNSSETPKEVDENKKEEDALDILSRGEQTPASSEAVSEENSDKENSTPVKVDACPLEASSLRSHASSALSSGSISPSTSSVGNLKKPATLDMVKRPEGSVREILAEIPVGLDISEDDYDSTASLSSSLLKGIIANNHKKKSASLASSLTTDSLDSLKKKNMSTLASSSLCDRLMDSTDRTETVNVKDVDTESGTLGSADSTGTSEHCSIGINEHSSSDANSEENKSSGCVAQVEELFVGLNAADKQSTLQALLRHSDYQVVVQSFAEFFKAQK